MPAPTVCWLKTPETGSLQAAPPKLNTHSSVHRQLTLTERHIYRYRHNNLCEHVKVIFNDAALYISFNIFFIIKIAARTDVCIVDSDQQFDLFQTLYSSTGLKYTFKGTCTLLEYFLFIPLYTSLPLHLGNYCTFFFTTFIRQL